MPAKAFLLALLPWLLMGLGTLRAAVRSTDWDLGCALLGTTGADFGMTGADFDVTGVDGSGEGLAGLNTSFPMLSTSLAMASLGGLCFSLDLSMFAAVLSSVFALIIYAAAEMCFPPFFFFLKKPF